jgi:hypothetical protein
MGSLARYDLKQDLSIYLPVSLSPAIIHRSCTTSRLSSHGFRLALATSAPTRCTSVPNHSSTPTVANPRLKITSSFTAHSMPHRTPPLFPPFSLKPSPLPTSSAIRARQRRRSASWPTPASLIRSTVRPQMTPVVVLPSAIDLSTHTPLSHPLTLSPSHPLTLSPSHPLTLYPMPPTLSYLIFLPQ